MIKTMPSMKIMNDLRLRWSNDTNNNSTNKGNADE
jgi:hypothetical protein